MKALFKKALKWYVIAVLVIIGIAALLISEERDTVRPMMIAVWALGGAYILATFWHQLNRVLFLCSVVVFLATAFLTQYAPYAVYMLTGYILEWGFYRFWALVTFFVGIPAMMYVFAKYD